MYTILVGGVDHTADIDPQSINLTRAITTQPDSVRFKVYRGSPAAWKPETFDSVVISETNPDGSSVIFGGTIIEIGSGIKGGEIEELDVVCKDTSFELDRKLVKETYTMVSAQSIIEDIIDTYTTGYTYNNVVAPKLVSYIAFNYKYPTKCFQQLAELLGYDWYVDEDKDVHFFDKQSLSAPFGLTDTNGKYLFDTLEISKDAKNLRNVVIVKGGTYLGDVVDEEQTADGEKLIYLLGNRYTNVFVEVDSVAQTVGIDNIDDPALFDCLYNYQEKLVRFKTATKPPLGDVVRVGGNPNLPVIVSVPNDDSIAEHGEWEFVIEDKSIQSKRGARDRASAELSAWASEIQEGSFSTREPLLEVGQTIHVQSDLRSIDQDFIISRITTKAINGLELEHSCTLVTSQTYGMIEFLQSLLREKEPIEVNEQEIVLQLLQFDDDLVNVYDELGDITVTTSEDYVWEQGDPMSDSYPNPIKWDKFTWAP